MLLSLIQWVPLGVPYTKGIRHLERYQASGFVWTHLAVGPRFGVPRGRGALCWELQQPIYLLINGMVGVTQMADRFIPAQGLLIDVIILISCPLGGQAARLAAPLRVLKMLKGGN